MARRSEARLNILISEENDMKNAKILILAIAATAALPLSAAEKKFVATDDSIETKICIAAAKNNLRQYKRTVDSLSHRKSIQRKVANKLLCNDENVYGFAKRYQADKVAGYLSRYVKHEVTVKRELSDRIQKSESEIISVSAD